MPGSGLGVAIVETKKTQSEFTRRSQAGDEAHGVGMLLGMLSGYHIHGRKA